MSSGYSTQAYPSLNTSGGAKWIKSLTKDRLKSFTGGRYADVNLSHVMFIHREDDEKHVKLQVWSAPGLTKPTFHEALKQKYKPAHKGDSFGPSFEFDPGCEAMIYTKEGSPLQGITGGFGGDRRVEFIIPPEARKQGFFDFVIESSANGMFGVPLTGDTIDPPDPNRYFTLTSADLVVPNMEAWGLFRDFQTLRELVDTLPENTPLQNQALNTANEIMNVLREGTESDIRAGRKLAEGIFGEGWEAKGADIYKEGPEKVNVWGIGYCHIDTAWLWPYSVTQQKVARSWSTQVDLMDRYPEHRFTCSSAQQFKWLEQQYPPLFARIKEKVASGQFQLVGGSWVENDGNMPSGEALARQFIYGQRYFQSRFGKRCGTAWLPDSFGLTGALPQLIRGSGMDYFFTQKLSWNNINVFPHSTFNWVGIDGSQVLCHMTPVDTYTAQATVGDVNKGMSNHKNLESTDTALLVFGNGDGGGGPLAGMLENLRRIRAVTNTHRELPPVSMGHSVEEFFDDLSKTTGAGKTLPNWHGELYLEFHRGTYTSHASIKKGNRKSEILLRDVEHLATLASLYRLHKEDYVYPKQIIDDSWEKVLLNQFHDVLPGSAIAMAYVDAEVLYAEVTRDGNKAIEDALAVLLPKSAAISPFTPFKSSASASNIIALNTTPFSRREIILLPPSGLLDDKAMVQASKNGRTRYGIMDCVQGKSQGSLVSLEEPAVLVFTNGSDHFVLRNSSVQLTIDKGRISSLLDVKLGRELIPEGRTGGLVIFEDRPGYWDAWDVEVYHLETARPLTFTNITVTSEGPLRASVVADVQYGQSTIRVTISLDAVMATTKKDSRSMITFDADVDWRQRHEFLKFEIPLDIHNDNATYEAPFGFVQRPTHKNTTWDAAKFEVCGHKYADLSEFGYGVAILSESKYGFACQGDVLRISLLRSSTAPDPEQDQGQHTFSWAILPHAGSFLESDVPMAAYLFNSPLFVRYLADPTESMLATIKTPFVVEGAPNVILETIKRGDDDPFGVKDYDWNKTSTTVVLRMYEAFGGHAKATLRIASRLPVSKVLIVNLLEDEGDELNVSREGEDVVVQLAFRGFEVKTVKLVIGGSGASEAPAKRDSWVTVGKLF